MTFPDIDSLDTYGGEFSDLAPIEDPTTDLAAASFNKLSCSVAMMTHNAWRVRCQFTAGASPALVSHDAAWGSSVSVQPTIARTGTGVYTITYASSYNDELTVAHTVSLRGGIGVAAGSTAFHVQVAKTAANVLTVYVFDMAGVATNGSGDIVVWGD